MHCPDHKKPVLPHPGDLDRLRCPIGIGNTVNSAHIPVKNALETEPDGTPLLSPDPSHKRGLSREKRHGGRQVRGNGSVFPHSVGRKAGVDPDSDGTGQIGDHPKPDGSFPRSFVAGSGLWFVRKRGEGRDCRLLDDLVVGEPDGGQSDPGMPVRIRSPLRKDHEVRRPDMSGKREVCGLAVAHQVVPLPARRPAGRSRPDHQGDGVFVGQKRPDQAVPKQDPFRGGQFAGWRDLERGTDPGPFPEPCDLRRGRHPIGKRGKGGGAGSEVCPDHRSGAGRRGATRSKTERRRPSPRSPPTRTSHPPGTKESRECSQAGTEAS